MGIALDARLPLPSGLFESDTNIQEADGQSKMRGSRAQIQKVPLWAGYDYTKFSSKISIN